MYSDALLDMLNRGLAENTISGAHGTGKMIFKRALEQDLLKSDPTQFARAPRRIATVEEIENKVELPKYLEKEELAHFLKVAQTNGLLGDYEMFLLLAYSGIRVGEMVVLRESDISDGKISITKTYYNPNNNAVQYKIQTPKTRSSIREVEVEPTVIKAIERYTAKIKEYKMLNRDVYYDKGYIFPNTNKNPGYPNFVKTIENRMLRLLRIAGLNESLTPHSLRHTHTSLLAEIGVPIYDIMDRLGHKDDATTRLVYMHVTKQRKKEASQKFGELMQNL
jgi:integrase